MGDISAQMVVRQASLVDLTRITDICLQGLPDDPTFDYLWRYRLQYPDDNSFFWQQRLKTSLFDAKRVVLVAIMKESVDCMIERDMLKKEGSPMGSVSEGDSANTKAKETIVAFAVWEINFRGVRPDVGERGWFDIFHGSLFLLLVFKGLILPKKLVRGSALHDAKSFLTFSLHGILSIRCTLSQGP